MTDTLTHHGILGQKWGVRRFQNEDGSLTYAGKKRYGVGIGSTKNNGTEYYRSRYDEIYNERKEKYKSGLNLIKKFNNQMDLMNEFDSIFNSLSSTTVYHPTITGGTEKLEITLFSEAASLVGIDFGVDQLFDMYDRWHSFGLLDSNIEEDTLKVLAAWDAYQQMGNFNWLPSVEEANQAYMDQIAKKDEEQKEINQMITELEKVGLSGLDPPIEVRPIDNTSFGKGIGYVMYVNGEPRYFKKDQIKEMRKVALENDLFFKDYRATSSGQRTREKNADTSQGAKKVTKRSKVDISDKERSEKEANSRKALEESADRLSDAMQKVKTQKEREEMKKAYEQFIKRTEGYSENESVIDKVKDLYKKTKKRLSHMDGGENMAQDDILVHHGVLGMKWGIRRYQNEDGTLTDLGKQRVNKKYSKGVNKLERYDRKVQKLNTKKNKMDEKLRKFDYKANRAKIPIIESWSGYEKRLAKNQLKLQNKESRYRKLDWKSEKAYNKGAKWVKKMEKKFKDIDLSSANVSQDDIDYVNAYLNRILDDSRRASHESNRRSSYLTNRSKK